MNSHRRTEPTLLKQDRELAMGSTKAESGSTPDRGKKVCLLDGRPNRLCLSNIFLYFGYQRSSSRVQRPERDDN